MTKLMSESTTASTTYAGFSETNIEEVSQGSIVVFGVPEIAFTYFFIR